jgi:phosphoenolpyruvate-protein phosphotransferase/dihydroxyacetone kinase phosphotransfer subunit
VIGLVLVCHSAKLAEGVAELAAQMSPEGLRIAVAGGLDQPGRPLGTDALLVARAIDEAWSPDGVLVLMDLGSAVLSAEMALDLLPQERRERVLLSEAPLVEGAVAAAVSAGLGDSLEKVADEARGALAGKAAHLVQTEGQPGGGPADGSLATAATGPDLRIVIANRLGLHARPAALLVRTAAGFEADVTVANVTAGRGPVSARSLNAVATLGLRRGHEMQVRAAGPQAREALAAVRRLADGNFGEPAQDGLAKASGSSTPAGPARAAGPQAAAAPPVSGAVLQGFPVSPGIATGPARHLRAVSVDVPDGASQDPAADWAALQGALAVAGDDISRTRDFVAARASGYDAAIFDAHLLFLEDEALLGPARAAIFEQGRNAARAWADAVSDAAAAWEALDDPYLRARAADLRGVGDQVLARLLEVSSELVGADSSGSSVASVATGAAATHAAGAGADATGAAAPTILLATDLTPAEIAALAHSSVIGVACAFGGPTSHGAILARSLGIPAAVGVGETLLGVADGTRLTLDGEAGTVTVDPPPAALQAAEELRGRWDLEAAEAREKAHLPAQTRDGRVVLVEANVSEPGDVEAALAAGADGVGLLRTELLFLAADHLPGEDEQEKTYRAAAASLGGRPLVVRTLDVGADKQLPYLPLAAEQNPFLGLRGIRLGLRRPELLAAQFRAILRVAADYPVQILLPMVATVDEVRRASRALEQAEEWLAPAGVAGARRVELGIMVEVPAAALLVEDFMPYVDFFSLGTNDLAQYVLAADRGNAAVAPLSDALHPAVLRLIERVARVAGEHDRRVAVCGEAAGDPLAIPILLGLGVSELSMDPRRIAAAKQIVRATELGAARQLAVRALTAESAAEVRRFAAESGDQVRRPATGSLIPGDGPDR